MKPNSKRKFAVFDIDWTLHRSALGTEFYVELSRAGLIPHDLEDHFKKWKAADDHATYFMEHFYPLATELQGIHRDKLETIGKQLAARVFMTITPKLKDIIESYREEGRFLVAITTSPRVAAEPLIDLLGFDAYVAPDFIYDEAGNYIEPRHRTDDEKDKGKVLAKLVDEYNLSWKDSAAYGDSLDDLPMLERVENPTPVDPVPALATIATKRGWNILRTVQN